MDECYNIIAAKWMLGWVQWNDCRRVNVAMCCVHTAWSSKICKCLVSTLRRTWEVYERFIFFVSAKEYSSKTDEHILQKQTLTLQATILRQNTITWSARLDMKQICTLDEFTFFKINLKRTESEIHYLLHNYCAPNCAWVLSCNPLGPRSDYTDSHDSIRLMK